MSTWLNVILTIIIVFLISLLDFYDRPSSTNGITENCDQIFSVKSFYLDGQIFKCKSNEDFCYIGITQHGISIQCKGVK